MKDEKLKALYLQGFRAVETAAPPFPRVWKRAQNDLPPTVNRVLATAAAVVVFVACFLVSLVALRQSASISTRTVASATPTVVLDFESTISAWRAPTDFLLTEIRTDNRIHNDVVSFAAGTSQPPTKQ